jgi:hypothetical protein
MDTGYKTVSALDFITIKLPQGVTSHKEYVIHWGDGKTVRGKFGDYAQIHRYEEAGSYAPRIEFVSNLKHKPGEDCLF